MKLSGIFYGVLTAIWMTVLGWAIWPLDSPYVNLPGATVSPKIVKALGIITISRDFKITRDEPIFVQRTLVRGDCKQSCEIVDLPSGNLMLPVGIYKGMTRDQILPITVEPGNWVARFSIQWRDRLGRSRTEPMEELSFTVVP